MLKSFKQMLVFIVLGLSIVVFVAVAFVGLSQLSSKSKSLVDLKLQSKVLESQLTNLQITKKQLQKYSFFNSVAKTVIPNDKDEAPAVIDVYRKAQASGIALQSIVFPASNLGGASASSTTTGTATVSGSSVTSSAPSQTTPVGGIPGLYSLKLTITPQIGQGASSQVLPTFSKFIDFLTRIENDRRTAQITEIDISPNDTALNFSLVLNIFIKP